MQMNRNAHADTQIYNTYAHSQQSKERKLYETMKLEIYTNTQEKLYENIRI